MENDVMAAAQGGQFSLRPPQLGFYADPTLAEAGLFQPAAAGQPVAQVWQGPQSLVVPASYKRYASLAPVREQFAAAGCPVFMRKSGGGLVPQGPGILNLSLAWSTDRTLGEAAEGVYHQLCGVLSGALADSGVATHFQAVEGSFCDGRFNLACGEGEQARKIAGTAQYWQAIPGQPVGEPRRHVVLAHAVLLVDCDLDAVHRLANQFEAAIGSGRLYQAAKTVSVAQMLTRRNDRLVDNIARALLRAVAASGVDAA
ncbi:lipoate-protein ligase A [Erwinia sp. ErVv1]|uniref:lipoyl protein ligase domain-containing protein n=2 Tax=unclassified Erwinia TaxID=2622719 RepID=UPI00082FE875